MIIVIDAPNYEITGEYTGLSLTVEFSNEKNSVHTDVKQLKKLLAVLEEMFEIRNTTHTNSLEELLFDLDK